MFCRKCGRENADDALFCQKCGTPVDAEEETRVARREEEPRAARRDVIEIETGAEEPRIFSITPTLKFVRIGYVATAVGALLLVALIAAFDLVSILVAIPIALALFLIPAYFHFRKKMIRYTLTDSKIEIDEGFIFQNSRNVPLRSIQDVSVSSTVTQRLLGFGNLEIDNASEDGGKIVLRDIDSPKKYADALLRQMRLLDK